MARLQSIVTSIFLFLSLSLGAQPELSSKNKRAVRLFKDGLEKYQFKNNTEAYDLLKSAIREDASFYEAQLTFADVCLDLTYYDEAIKAYSAADLIKKDKYPPMYLRWAQAEIAQMKFDAAAAHLEYFLALPKPSNENRKKATRLLKSARFSATAMLHPVPFDPTNLGAGINGPYSDYHPSITVDGSELIFTRLRPSDEQTNNGGSKFEEDFYVSKMSPEGWTPAKSIGSPLNSHGNEGAHCLSPDGRMIFFTACERPDGFGSCDIYVSQRNGSNWVKPINLGELVNSATWDAQPTISPDGRELIFVSRRTGTKGMGDLWSSKLQNDGTWGLAVNLGDSINTDQDESGPFLHPDGQTLYFSSAGLPGLGSRDFFMCKRQSDGNWGAPVNLGYPVNTPSDESHMIVSADGKRGFFSSDRPGGLGQKDIYSFVLPEQAQARATTYMRGKVRHKTSGAPVSARFEVIDIASGRLMASSISDPVTGAFLISLPAGASYAVNARASGFLFFSENFTLDAQLNADEVFEAVIDMVPIATGERIVLKNIFFESGSATLDSKSETELNTLFEFLSNNATLKIEIGGHTDNVGVDEANLKLSEDRALAVKNFLVEKGIQSTRINAKGYGETVPVAPNTDEAGRKQNRRTEFVVIK
ncbi:MAG: OmpA family protein [Bacteroidia bacterium]|jgi:outer membrane protein OmpA-like peptidoglycan-associated protein/Tol biopolymer transport system component